MLKHDDIIKQMDALMQPPSGGCVLKHDDIIKQMDALMQPPSGGCVLKLENVCRPYKLNRQPPSGGCVLKHGRYIAHRNEKCAATFGWLCVETTTSGFNSLIGKQPPSGGCVLKPCKPLQKLTAF